MTGFFLGFLMYSHFVVISHIFPDCTSFTIFYTFSIVNFLVVLTIRVACSHLLDFPDLQHDFPVVPTCPHLH